MDDALIVNPYDVEAVASGIHAAAHMKQDEQRTRMRGLRRTVEESDVIQWARACLAMLEDA